MTIEICPETPARHAEAIEALFDATFGPGHFAKTAERLREFSRSLPQLTRIAVRDEQLIGVCRVWPIRVGDTPALFYGPVAVARAHRGDRLGLALTREALEAGKSAGWGAAMLIGAPAYFGEIGFETVAPGALVLPGPQDSARVMVRALAGECTLTGPVTAAPDLAVP